VTGTLGRALFGGMVDPQGQLWLGGTSGGLFRGHVAGATLSVQLVSHTPKVSGLLALDGDTDPASFELFSVSDRGAFWRYDGQAWQLLAQAGTSTHGFYGGVVRLGPGRAIAGWEGDPHVFEIDGHIVNPVDLAPGSGDAPTALVRTAEGPILAEGPRLFRYTGTSFERFGADLATSMLNSIAPFRDGVIGSSFSGSFQQFTSAGPCPTLVFLHGGFVRWVLAVGNELAFVGETPRNDRLAVTFFRPKN
jgi:hypothetical protein